MTVAIEGGAVDRQPLKLDKLKQEINQQLSLDPDTQDCIFEGIIAEIRKPGLGQPNWTVFELQLRGRPTGKAAAVRRVIEKVRKGFNLP